MYGDADDETDEGDALCNDMLADKENLLGDLRDYLTRPVGETIAKLCVALGLPADACVKQDGVWLIARDPSPYEKYRQTRAADQATLPARRWWQARRDSSSLPPPKWGGTDGEAVRVGQCR